MTSCRARNGPHWRDSICRHRVGFRERTKRRRSHPLTLLVILLGMPPVGVFTFFLAAAVAKHMTHAIPTALLGIPGDTMAIPLLQQATFLRNLGVPAHRAPQDDLRRDRRGLRRGASGRVFLRSFLPLSEVHHSSRSLDLCSCGLGDRLFLRRPMGLSAQHSFRSFSHRRVTGPDGQVRRKAQHQLFLGYRDRPIGGRPILGAFAGRPGEDAP